MTDENLIEKVILLMVSGLGKKEIRQVCEEKFEINSDDIEDFINKAQVKIIETSDFNKEKEVGTAVIRLNHIYSKAIASGDIKTALQTQRELDKLQGLYKDEGAPGANEGDTGGILEAEKELQAIAEHLLPLELADSSYPLREHARIASERIREAQSFGKE